MSKQAGLGLSHTTYGAIMASGHAAHHALQKHTPHHSFSTGPSFCSCDRGSQQHYGTCRAEHSRWYRTGHNISAAHRTPTQHSLCTMPNACCLTVNLSQAIVSLCSPDSCSACCPALNCDAARQSVVAHHFCWRGMLAKHSRLPLRCAAATVSLGTL
jgi:hypothetical protein